MILPHARKRFAERYGIKLTRAFHKKLVADIQHNQTRNREKQTHTRSRCEVNIKGEWIPVIYSNKHKVIITALKREVA